MKLSLRNKGKIKTPSDKISWQNFKGLTTADFIILFFFNKFYLLKFKRSFFKQKKKGLKCMRVKKIKKMETLWLIEKHIV